MRSTPIPGVEIYTHSATVAAKSSDPDNPDVQIPIADVSTAGPEPDPNRNNNAEEDEPNIIELKLQADVDIGIRASTPIPQDGESYFTELTLTVTNEGNLGLSNVDLQLNLDSVFPDGFVISDAITNSNGSIVLNSGFDGVVDLALFDADDADQVTSTLTVGDSTVVTVPVIFNPGAATSFIFDAAVIADSTSGSVSDVASTDVANGEDAPASISIESTGVLGVALSASPARELAPAINPAERCEQSACVTTVTINVENLGNTDIEDVQIEQIFGGLTGLPEGTEIVIRLISTSGDVQGENLELVDQVFIVGVDDPILLLDGTGSIPVGGQGEIELVVEFTLPEGTLSESFELSSLAAGVDENGVAVSDESDNGSATDANGNGPADDKRSDPVEHCVNAHYRCDCKGRSIGGRKYHPIAQRG